MNPAVYDTIRLVATMECDGTSCPSLNDWAVEWSEGVPVSGTIKQSDRLTNVTSGTVQVAVNNTPGNTGSIAGDGTWSINNVTAFEGDVVTVWVTGASDENEAVGVFVYGGVGDMTGVELFEKHLSLSADSSATNTNALLSTYDNSVSSNEDIFFDVDALNDLDLCTVSGCDEASLYIGSGEVYRPDSSSSGNVEVHDFINDGTLVADANTVRVSGSWQNNATTNISGSTVLFTATSTNETVDDSSGTLNFHNLTFGETLGTATWKTSDPLNLTGSLQVDYGTLDRSSSTIMVSGGVQIGVNGLLSGISTTTFNGSGSSSWTDNSSDRQDLGYVVIDGDSKSVSLQSSVKASNITIGANDTLNAGGANTLYLSGNFTNNNIFVPQTGTIQVIGSGTNAIIKTNNSSLYNLIASTTDSGNIAFSEQNVTLLGSLTIATGTVTMPVGTTTIGGSFLNQNGVFAHNNASVVFNGTGNKNILVNGDEFLNAFYDVSFSGSGNWTFLDTNATSSNTFLIKGGTVNLPSGQLSVDRDFVVTGGSFNHNDGEIVLAIRADDVFSANGSAVNDLRIIEGSPIPEGNYSPQWLYREMITVHSTNIDENLTDFPVYIDLNNFGTNFFDRINSDGGDIRITESDGISEVPREVVSASTTAETGEVYFKAPTLSSTTDTVFYIYYGNATATDYAVDDTYGAENVWDSNYLGVYHLYETSTGVANEFTDSTANGNHGRGENTLPSPTTGKIGGGQDMANGHIDLGSGFTDIGTNNEYTIETWVNLDASGDYSLVSQWGGGASGYLWWADAAGVGTGFCHYTDGTYTPTNIWATGSDCQSDDSQTIGSWQYGAIRYENGSANTHINGTTTGAVVTGLSYSQAGVPFSIGSEQGNNNNRAINGQMDEVRISSIDRGSAWVRASYLNQSTTTDFYTNTVASANSMTRTLSDATLNVIGNIIIESGQVQFPNTALNIGGSFDNDGTFVAGSGLVNFNSTSTGNNVAPGSSSFYDLSFDGIGGGWTVVENATTTNSLLFNQADDLTVDSGVILESVGSFTNNLANASTTWTGATLLLSGGNTYTVNNKNNEGDDYNSLVLDNDTHVSFWNSSASTYSLNNSSSLYSQDHDAVDGDLYIFGNYTRASGTEYWSYATDFDGNDLSGGSERQVDVRVASSSVVNIDGSTLSIFGTTTASTTIDSINNNFSLNASSSVINASYFNITGTDMDGLNLTASSTLTTFSNGLFDVPTGLSGLTIDASTIDTNPAKQIFNIGFATTTAGTASNVTLSGSPSSFIWFRSGFGNLYGEAFDNNDANPGSVRFDDSSNTVTVSGVVYSDDGQTTMGAPTCNGIVNNVRIIVDGGSYDSSTSCDAVTGAYSFPAVTYTGDPEVIVYLDTNGGEVGSVVTKTMTGDVTDMDVYANRVILRHEDTSPLNISDMTAYDFGDDADVKFTASTSTGASLLTLLGTELYVWASSTFSPLGTVTLQANAEANGYDGSLVLATSSTFLAYGTSTYTIGGRFVQGSGAIFSPASSTVLMNATTTGKSITSFDPINFYELTFNGTGGGWNIGADLVIDQNVNINNGTVTGTGDIEVVNGNISGDGTLSMGNGTVTVDSTNVLGGNTAWTFNNLTLGDGVSVGTTTLASGATTTILGALNIANGHTLNGQNLVFDLAGTGNVFVETGTFAEANSLIRYSGAGANVLDTNYYDLLIDAGVGPQTYIAQGTGILVRNDLTIGNSQSSTFDINTNDPVLEVRGNMLIGAYGTLSASNNSALTASADWTNNGVFTSNNGTVSFTSSSTSNINAGNSNFYNVDVNGPGDFVVTNHATATNAWTLTSHNNFTVNSGQVLAVGGQFTNTLAGSSTTWTGSTLHLFGNSTYTINSSTTADTYNTISVASSTQIRMWNSDASIYSVDSSGSLYSQDHAGVDGDLYVWGNLSRTSGSDYWSYATDFDGTDLSGGSERQVDVYFESGANTSWTGGSLNVIGSSSASTTLQNQGSGNYSFTINGTTNTNWKTVTVRDIDENGIVFDGTPTVTNFSNTDHLVEIDNATAVTVSGTVINQNPAKNFTGNVFVASGGVVNPVNVTATGTSVSSWRFTNHLGVLSGETSDDDPAGDPGYIVWDDSAALITVSGNVYSDEGVTVSSVCDGSTTNIRLVVAGLTTYDTSCNASTGAYSIPNVAFSGLDTLTLYINGETEKAANVSISPISSISNMHLYENRVIVRHENSAPITIDDMAVWDSSDDTDILFTAISGSPNTLTLPADTKLIVWNSKTFAPGGNVTLSGAGAGADYDGSLEVLASGVFTASGSESHSVGGSIVFGNNAVFTPASSTVTLTTTGSARTIDVNNANLHNLTLTGSGSWTVTDSNLYVANNYTQSAGTLTLPTATTTIGGSFNVTAGNFDINNSPLVFTATDAGNIIRFNNSIVDDVVINGDGGSFSMNDTNATSTGNFVVKKGSVTLPGGNLAVAKDFLNEAGTLTHNTAQLILTSPQPPACKPALRFVHSKLFWWWYFHYPG
ncbi:MAG: DUF2341 domain-containing protein [Candidatus Paceibacterota bacterium]